MKVVMSDPEILWSLSYCQLRTSILSYLGGSYILLLLNMAPFHTTTSQWLSKHQHRRVYFWLYQPPFLANKNILRFETVLRFYSYYSICVLLWLRRFLLLFLPVFCGLESALKQILLGVNDAAESFADGGIRDTVKTSRHLSTSRRPKTLPRASPFSV